MDQFVNNEYMHNDIYSQICLIDNKILVTNLLSRRYTNIGSIW